MGNTQIQISFFENLDEVLNKLMIADQDYNINLHPIQIGDWVGMDTHSIDEWIIFPAGKGICGEVFLYAKWHRIKLDKDKVTVVFIPKNQQHNFAATRNMIYKVLKGPKETGTNI